jgi:hypothetical protein
LLDACLLEGRVNNLIPITKHDSASGPHVQGDRNTKPKGTIVPMIMGPDRPQIVISHRYDDDIVHDYVEAIQASNAIHPWVFSRGREIYYPRRHATDGIYLAVADEPAMDYILSQVARTVKEITIDDHGEKKKAFIPAPVPRRILQQLLRLPELPFPSISSVTHVPGLRQDGTLYREAGYDTDSMVYFDPQTAIPDIPEYPTPNDVKNAVEKIYDILDFPFITQTDRANAIAFALTLVCRQAINDIIPMSIVNALSDKGTGKTFLVQMIHLMTTAQEAPTSSLPEEEAEIRKTLTTAAEESKDFVFFDNVRGIVKSRALESVLTMLRWHDRILGSNRSVDSPLRVNWVMTGNHMSLGNDLSRRCYFIHLQWKDAPKGRAYLVGTTPETQRRYPNMREHILEHQSEYLAAFLIIARAWYAAGRPKPTKTTLLHGTYKTWCDTIGGMLEHAGIEGFLATHEHDLDEQEDETYEWEAFFTACVEQFGNREVGAGDIVAALSETESNPIIESLPGVLVKERDKDKSNRAFAITLGRFLKNRRSHPVGDTLAYVEEAGRDKHTKKTLWRFGVQSPKDINSQSHSGEVQQSLPPAPVYKPIGGTICKNRECQEAATSDTIIECPDKPGTFFHNIPTCKHIFRPIVISNKVAEWKDGGLYTTSVHQKELKE